MVDISEKKITKREACASSKVIFSQSTFKKIVEAGSPKGEILILQDVQVSWPQKNKRNNTSMPYYKSKWH